jgi:hypothetical protein
MLGLILSILGSALVFAFSHVLRDGDVIRFQEPKEFVLTQRDTSKYYPHVGIYLNANQLRNGQDQMYVRDEWIKLLDLTISIITCKRSLNLYFHISVLFKFDLLCWIWAFL